MTVIGYPPQAPMQVPRRLLTSLKEKTLINPASTQAATITANTALALTVTGTYTASGGNMALTSTTSTININGDLTTASTGDVTITATAGALTWARPCRCWKAARRSREP